MTVADNGTGGISIVDSSNITATDDEGNNQVLSQQVWIAGENGKIPGIVRATYDASGWADNVTSSDRDVSASMEWLLDE